MSAGHITKPGRHGTLYLYAVTITPCDPGQPPYTVRRWGYSADHACDRVADDPMTEGDDVGPAVRVRA